MDDLRTTSAFAESCLSREMQTINHFSGLSLRGRGARFIAPHDHRLVNQEIVKLSPSGNHFDAGHDSALNLTTN